MVLSLLLLLCGRRRFRERTNERENLKAVQVVLYCIIMYRIVSLTKADGGVEQRTSFGVGGFG